MSTAASVATETPMSGTPDAAVPEPVSPGKSKRSFFGLGKKRKDQDAPSSPPRDSSPKIVDEKAPQLPQLASIPPMNTSLTSPSASPSASTTPRIQTLTPSPPSTSSALLNMQQPPPKTPTRSLHSASSPVLTPHSPSTPHAPSQSPSRGLSTSSSMIFERNVQEHPNNPNIPVPMSSAIPAHIQTENFIPPVLEASSLAITDRNCGVDEVEIVMHSAHQPALSVGGLATSLENYSSLDHTEDPSSYSGDDLSSHGGGIGASAAADKRRLSFISFADVVQAEQAEQYGDIMTHSTSSPSRGSPVQSAADPAAMGTINETMRRSPSPIRLGSTPSRGSLVQDPNSLSSINETLRRSPSSIRLGNSPPRSTYMAGERSPGSPGSPGRTAADHIGVERGELTIETMRQALKKTGSGDLGQRSPIASSSAFSRTT
ncbi:hypothetical protein BZA05DRAFT_385443 [Tricharina praecox]|uniref:uncharacterized protein n=1 Tax=Tricharina praecox TaxID=43433 RepID=UPI00221F226C|nr:uncharacterized protein BZA05DRAFT_385443 [Tricharina praecox]KAI5857975.1 hypothetical protein BZA05DRAFT_385443 [Tricharina praecox]